jgi:hypothetical protein
VAAVQLWSRQAVSNATMKLKHFIVYLRDNREVQILAETYRHDGEQYVFDKPGSNEVQFFLASEVIAIIEAPPSGASTIPIDRRPLI